MKPLRSHHLLASLAPFALALVAACAEGRSIPDSPNVCGDGEVAGDEQCDEGGDNSDDEPGACRKTCLDPACGDGIVDPGEGCDDGNVVSGDGCDDDCKEGFICGDETCSDELGESCSVCKEDCCPCGDDVCSAGELCTECPSDCCPDCGNGTLDPGEGCEDGNNDAGDGCGIGCTDEDGTATCGNGIPEAGEACEDGNTEPADGCGVDCQLEYVCGDLVCEGDVGENCANCLGDCCPNCGDGVINDAEECDGPVPPTAPTCTDRCYAGGTTTCVTCLVDYESCEGEPPVCGNGLVECGEECDAEDLAAATCDTLGFDGGRLACDGGCTFDLGACGAPVPLLALEGFETCPPAGWTLGGIWACGVPSSGPEEANTGTRVLATNLSGEYPDNREFDTDFAQTPPFEVRGDAPTLAFFAWLHTESNYDGMHLEVSTNGGSPWSVVDGVTPAYTNEDIDGASAWDGVLTSWQLYSADLSPYAGQTVSVRFAFRSDVSGTYDGVYVDDVVAVSEPALLPVAIAPVPPPGDAYVDQLFTLQLGTVYPGPVEWEIVDETNASWLSIDGGSGLLSGAPAVADVGPASVTVRATRVGTPSLFEEVTLSVTVVDTLFVADFEPCDDDFVLTTDWSCGPPTEGPSACRSGSNCLGTNGYANDRAWGSTTATSPTIDLQGTSSPELRFWFWQTVEGCCDGTQLQISVEGGPWSVLQTSLAYEGNLSGQVCWSDNYETWTEVTADLTPYAGQSVAFRWSLRSDFSNTEAGPYVDDVIVIRD